jgi:uncharacterized protein YerC
MSDGPPNPPGCQSLYSNSLFKRSGEQLTAERRKARSGHVRDRQSPHEAATIERRREHVARLVLDGNTYRTIAEQLDVSLATIADDVHALRGAYRERYAEDFAAHASIELAKLDRAEQVLWPQIDDGKLAAIETFVKISRRRAQLLGLDKPERVEAVVHQKPPATDGRTITEMLSSAMAQAKAQSNGD